MKISDAFPSKYLKASDLENDVHVTIKRVVKEPLKNKAGKDEEKPVVYFEEGDKGLVCNRTNWNSIAKQHGDESDDWAGKTVTLTVAQVDSFGEIVDAIRIKAPKKASGGSAFPKASPPATDEKSWPAARVEEIKVWLIDANLVPPDSHFEHVKRLLDLGAFGPAISKESLLEWAKLYRALRDRDFTAAEAAKKANESFSEFVQAKAKKARADLGYTG